MVSVVSLVVGTVGVSVVKAVVGVVVNAVVWLVVADVVAVVVWLVGVVVGFFVQAATPNTTAVATTAPPPIKNCLRDITLGSFLSTI